MIDKTRIKKFRDMDVWQLTPDEIEWIYRKLHMNSYVRAALLMYHCSPHPAGHSLKLRADSIPSCIREPLNRLISLSPHLNSANSQIVRKHCLLHCYNLFKALAGIKHEDIRTVIDIMALTAFIPVIAEKNDNLPLWTSPAVRTIRPHYKRGFDAITDDIDLNSYIKFPFGSSNEEDKEIYPELVLFHFIPRAVASIITRIENEGNTEEETTAFLRVEKAMRNWEEQHATGGADFTPFCVRNPGQIRYRNTLYLYGGDHLSSRGLGDEAFNWYCRDIYTLRLPESCGFYLTDLKTCERLIKAWPLHPDPKQKNLFRSLIDRMLLESFKESSEHALNVLSVIDDNPEQDLSAMRLPRKNGRPLMFAGEAMRELFLISLLYKNYVAGTDFSDFNYNSILEIS